MSRLNRMPGGKGRSANHMLPMFRDDFFVANAVLHRAHRCVLTKGMSRLRDGNTRMDCFGRDDAIVAARQLFGITRRVKIGSEIGSARKSQAVFANRVRVILPDIVSPDFGRTCLGKMSRKEAAHGPAADDANTDPRHYFWLRV